MITKSYQEIREEIDKIPIIDTHEHIRNQQDLIKEGVSLFTSLKYSILWPDFISAGMAPELWEDTSQDPEEDWKKISLYIDSVQTASYFRTLLVAYRDLFGFQDMEVNEGNWRKLSDSINQSYQKEDLYQSVLNKVNIEKVLIDVIENPGSIKMPSDLEAFVPTLAIDPLIFIKSKKFFVANPIFNPKWFSADPLGSLLKNWNLSYETFDDYISIIDTVFEKLKEVGAAAIKFRFSYFRDMVVGEVSRAEAQKAFDLDEEELTREDVKRIEDFMIKSIIRKAIECEVPIQVHTGLFGNVANDPRKGHPYQLINLFTEFPKAKFILFHASYPFTGEMASVVKAFPNVYLDICWTSWILHNNLQRYLAEWLAVIPSNKIVLGGDTECIERSYASIAVAKNILAEVLAEYVDRGTYSKKMALGVARKILRENAMAIYKL